MKFKEKIVVKVQRAIFGHDGILVYGKNNKYLHLQQNSLEIKKAMKRKYKMFFNANVFKDKKEIFVCVLMHEPREDQEW